MSENLPALSKNEQIKHQETQQLRRELQSGASKELNARRAIIGLSLLGMGAMTAVSLFQTRRHKTLARPAD